MTHFNLPVAYLRVLMESLKSSGAEDRAVTIKGKKERNFKLTEDFDTYLKATLSQLLHTDGSMDQGTNVQSV